MSFLRFLLAWSCCLFFGSYVAITFGPQEMEAVKLALMVFSAYVLDDILGSIETKGES